ncbi:MAG: hypothetical protein ACKV2O_06240 [Acidimicrobiales bacterium]
MVGRRSSKGERRPTATGWGYDAGFDCVVDPLALFAKVLGENIVQLSPQRPDCSSEVKRRGRPAELGDLGSQIALGDGQSAQYLCPGAIRHGEHVFQQIHHPR